MKKTLGYLVVSLVIVCLFIFNLYRNERTKVSVVLNEKNILLKQYDSIANLPPDTLELEPIYIRDTVEHVVERWYSEPDSLMKVYSDSIKNDSIDISVSVLARKVSRITFNYKPIILEKSKIIYQPKPYPVTETVEREVLKRSLYITTGIGIADKFAGKLGLVYTTKNKQLFEFDYLRYGNQNIYLGTYGIKF